MFNPLDMIGIDYLGPIKPESKHGSQYVVIIVDYFSRYCWALAVGSATGRNALRLLGQVSRTFGFPRSAYSDNATHFSQGEFFEFLRKHGIRNFPVPKTHPSSVGLSERFVQMVLYALRKLMFSVSDLSTWEDFLEPTIQCLNTRMLKIQGFTPAQLLLGFNPRYNTEDFTPEDLEVAEDIASKIETSEIVSVETRLALLEEIQSHARDRLFESHAKLVESAGLKTRWTSPKEGDLVLLRRFELDAQRGRKLEARWEGPFILVDVAHHGLSGRLKDINTGKIVRVRQSGTKERCHIDDLRVFVPRESKPQVSVNNVQLHEFKWELSLQDIARMRREGIDLKRLVSIESRELKTVPDGKG